MMKTLLSFMVAALPAVAHAQETIDLGVLKDSDIKVVQKLLYPKTGRTELGIHLGVSPFDAYTRTPFGAVSYGSFLSESVAWEVVAQGGYSFKTSTYRELESPLYSVAPDAYRLLGGISADVQYSPIYAKMNVAGKQIVHYDVYGLAGLGVTAEVAILPDHSFWPAPTVPLGVGARFYLNKDAAVRFQVVDELLVERRAKTETWALRHDIGVSIGYTMLSKVGK